MVLVCGGKDIDDKDIDHSGKDNDHSYKDDGEDGGVGGVVYSYRHYQSRHYHQNQGLLGLCHNASSAVPAS